MCRIVCGEMGLNTMAMGCGSLWTHAQQVVFCEKEGINAGVSGLIRHYPRADVNVVILSNMEQGVWTPIRKVHEIIIAGQLAWPRTRSVEVDPPDYDATNA